MDTHKFRKPNPILEKFKASLITDRPAMDAIRNTMSDADYGKICGVSSTTVIKYMGYVDKKLYNGMPRVEIDIEATNKLRWQYNDGEVAKMLKCSSASISKYCGTRKALGIHHIGKNNIIPDILPDLKPAIAPRKKESILLNSERWEVKEEKPYWDTSTEVKLFQGPHKFLFSKLS